jgi:hypothetical protein
VAEQARLTPGAALRFVPILALSVGFTGCASLPPAQPIPAVSTIAGKWSGSVQFGRGPYELFYLTINPDGSLVAWWGATTRWGKVDVSGKRPRFSLYIWSGDLQYSADGRQRLLVLKEDFDSFYAQVRPLE